MSDARSRLTNHLGVKLASLMQVGYGGGGAAAAGSNNNNNYIWSFKASLCRAKFRTGAQDNQAAKAATITRRVSVKLELAQIGQLLD